MSVGSPAVHRFLALLLSLLLCAACKQSRRHSSVAPSPAERKGPDPISSAEVAIAACALVTTEEVGAIQKATITDAKSSAQPSGSFIMSHCYYNAKEPNKAVSLAVIEPNPKSSTGREVRDYWAGTFGRVAEGSTLAGEKHEKDQKPNEKREEEEKRTPPKKIDGIGEEAYWNGNRFGGALYVLKSNLIVRISVGGPDGEEVKINKSKAIAEKAISRL